MEEPSQEEISHILEQLNKPFAGVFVTCPNSAVKECPTGSVVPVARGKPTDKHRWCAAKVLPSVLTDTSFVIGTVVVGSREFFATAGRDRVDASVLHLSSDTFLHLLSRVLCSHNSKGGTAKTNQNEP
jgi:hypothetical protein